MNEVRKRHNERKISTEQHFCSKCGDRLESKYSPCGQCDSELEQSKQKHRRIHVKGENKSVLPQSSFSFSVKGFPTLLVIGAILGFTTFAIIGMVSTPDVIYIESDFGGGGYYDGGCYGDGCIVDDGYYDDGYYDGYYDDYYYGDYYG